MFSIVVALRNASMTIPGESYDYMVLAERFSRQLTHDPGMLGEFDRAEGPAYWYDGCRESLREPCVLRGAGEPPSPISNFGGAGGAADVTHTRWTTPGDVVSLSLSMELFGKYLTNLNVRR